MYHRATFPSGWIPRGALLPIYDPGNHAWPTPTGSRLSSHLSRATRFRKRFSAVSKQIIPLAGSDAKSRGPGAGNVRDIATTTWSPAAPRPAPPIRSAPSWIRTVGYAHHLSFFLQSHGFRQRSWTERRGRPAAAAVERSGLALRSQRLPDERRLDDNPAPAQPFLHRRKYLLQEFVFAEFRKELEEQGVHHQRGGLQREFPQIVSFSD